MLGASNPYNIRTMNTHLNWQPNLWELNNPAEIWDSHSGLCQQILLLLHFWAWNSLTLMYRTSTLSPRLVLSNILGSEMGSKSVQKVHYHISPENVPSSESNPALLELVYKCWTIVTFCLGIKGEEPWTAHPMSLTCASHITASQLTGDKLYSINQITIFATTRYFFGEKAMFDRVYLQ